MRALSLAFLVLLVPLVACQDDLAKPDVALRRDNGNGKGNGKNDTTPPTPDPVDPNLPGFFLDSMLSPVRLALTPEDRLLVSDSRHQMVLRVDPVQLQPDQGLAARGKPSAVAHYGQRVYVGNPDRETVDMYAAQGGAYDRDFGRGMVGHAMDIAVDPTLALVFVVDGKARQVKVFDTDGGLIRYISGPGTGPSQLITPIGVAVDTANQQILVSDYGAPPTVKASVKVFGYDGTYVEAISGAGNCGMMGCSGGFSRPQGLAVRNGRVYLVDAMLSQVLVFDRVTKKVVKTLGAYPTLHVPTDLVVTDAGDLYVVSNATASVVSFPGGAQ